MASLRFGVVGIGYGQQVLVPAIRAVPGCEVVALAASSQERAAIAERLGVATAYGDWRDLVASDGVDAVAIAVPPIRHRRSLLLPPATASTCCARSRSQRPGRRRRRRAGRPQGRIAAGIDFQYRFIPAWAEAHRQLQAGAIGAVRHASILWHVETYANRRRLTSWKTAPEDGGGALASMGSHVLHYVEWLFGPIASISCQGHGWPGQRRRRGGEPLVTLVLGLASGAVVSVTIGTNYGQVRPPHRGVRRGGATGADQPGPGLHGRVLGGGAAARRPPTVVWADPVESGVDGRIPPVVALVTELAEAIRQGGPAAPSVEPAGASSI